MSPSIYFNKIIGLILPWIIQDIMHVSAKTNDTIPKAIKIWIKFKFIGNKIEVTDKIEDKNTGMNNQTTSIDKNIDINTIGT